MDLLKTLPKQAVNRRRDIVRHLFHTGLSISLILERFESQDFDLLFPPLADYDDRYSLIAADIAAIKKESLEAVNITAFDVQEQHALYIDRQQFLYRQALADGNLALARVISQDIAKSYGIQVDEPIEVRGDLLSMLRGAQQAAARKIEERKAIDVTPLEVMPDKPAADAIFVKR